MDSVIYFLNTFGLDLLRSVIALFVVIDPLGTIPLFITITHKKSKKERNEIAKTAVITAGGFLMIFAIAGTQILSIFGNTIASFMIAGGILLFIISVELLTHRGGRFGGNISDDSGVIPLAFLFWLDLAP